MSDARDDDVRDDDVRDDDARDDDARDGGPVDGDPVDGDLDLAAFATAIENFNRFYIRLPTLQQLSFTTLSVLDTLASAEGPLRLTELAGTEQMSQPGLTQLVTRLERDGLVERRPDPRDGRAVLVHITQAGRDIGRSRHADRARHLTPLVDQLTPEQRRAVAHALPVLSRLAELGRERAAAGE